MTTEADLRSTVDRIRRKNETDFGAQARRAVQKMLNPALPHPWMYVYELTQNALDAGARRVNWQIHGDGVLFQHDGNIRLNESHVRGIASLGASTKGLDAVGFMGIGFKSVFARFREAHVVGNGWRFWFDIGVQRGALGVVIPEWFDTLRPHWDDDGPQPDRGYTTAFLLCRPDDEDRPLSVDLSEIASLTDPTPLAVLALRGLEQARVGDNVWDLSVDDDIVTLCHSHYETVWRWKAFVSSYRPDDAAMRQFLRVREGLQDQVDNQGRRVERSVVGLLPLDKDRLPTPADTGCMYSTLPTRDRTCLGFHLQADWLVDIDRQNLREVDGNPWQEAIVRQIPDLLRQLLEWLTNASDAVRQRGYDALRDPTDDGGFLGKPLREMRDDLRSALADVPVIPIHGVGFRRFRTPDLVARLPDPFRDTFGSRWRPDLLFGLDLIDETFLGKYAADFARWLGWGGEIHPDDIDWAETLPRWWQALPKEERPEALFELWDGVGESGWDGVPVVPTEAGVWTQGSRTVWLREEPPTEKQPGGAAVAVAIADYLPRADQRLPASLRHHVNRVTDDRAQWLKRQHKELELAEVIQRACDAAPNTDQLPLVELLEWALSRGVQRKDLVPLVLTEDGARKPAKALLADPLVPGGKNRRLLFSNLPALVADYARVGDRQAVVLLLERLGIRGGSALEKREVREYVPKEVAALLDIHITQVQAANSTGYLVVDYDFEFAVVDVPPVALQDWLSLEHNTLRDKGRKNAYSSYYGSRTTWGQVPASWVRALQDNPWLLCTDGQRRRPAETLPEADPDFEDAPIADIDPELAARLEAEGVRFGHRVVKSPVLRRLELRGSADLPEGELAVLLQEAREHVEAGKATTEDLLRGLKRVKLNGVPLSSHVVQRTGAGGGQRSDLGGWVVALSDVDSALAVAVSDLPLEVPETTTGWQALTFLRDVWARKPSRVEDLRGRLATAYRYVLEDLDTGILSADDWSEARPAAHLYGRRTWHPSGPRLVVDDVQSPLIHQFLPKRRIAVASSHLGDTGDQVRRVAKALELGVVSDEVSVELGTPIDTPPWAGRLRRLIATLTRLEDRRPLHEVMFLDALSLRVVGQSHPIQAYGDDGTLMLVGSPSTFAVEATGQLVEYFQMGQRGNEVPWLTGALFALGNEEEFLRNLQVLADGLGVDIAHPPPTVDEAPSSRRTLVDEPVGDPFDSPVDDSEQEAPAVRRENGQPMPPVPTRDRPAAPNDQAPRGDSDPTKRGGHRVRSTRPSSTGLRAADHFGAMVVTQRRREDSAVGDAGSGRGSARNDYAARQAVIHYEKHQGRRAEAMDDQHPGFDVLSVDDATGHRRHIEVKGVQGVFKGDASVVLTARQVHDAVQHEEEGTEYWLYVVDSTETTRPRVFPIPWARRPALLRYGFYAHAWADDAERPAVVTAQTLTDLSREALGPLDPGDLAGDFPDDEA